MRKNYRKLIIWGGLIVAFYLFWALIWIIYAYFVNGSMAHPYVPRIDLPHTLLRPLEQGYILGTDKFGRSLFQVICHGLVYTTGFSLSCSLIICSFGIVVGYLSVRSHHFIQTSLNWFSDLIFIFPNILIALLIVSFSESQFWGLFLALSLTGWPLYAKVTRTEVSKLLGLPFVESAQAIGIGEFRLFFKVILPNLIPQLLVHLVLGIGGIIIIESMLGFLGFAGSRFSWGVMMAQGKTVLLEAPHIVIILSITLSGLIIGLNLIGDGLREYLDKKAN